MTDAAIEKFFADYSTRLSCFDVAGICDYWLLPATINVGENTTNFDTLSAFTKNVETLCRFYKEQGVTSARASIVSNSFRGEGCARVCVQYILSGQSGQPINAWKHHYMLRKTRHGWRIACATADEEISAWAQKGTPLG